MIDVANVQPYINWLNRFGELVYVNPRSSEPEDIQLLVIPSGNVHSSLHHTSMQNGLLEQWMLNNLFNVQQGLNTHLMFIGESATIPWKNSPTTKNILNINYNSSEDKNFRSMIGLIPQELNKAVDQVCLSDRNDCLFCMMSTAKVAIHQTVCTHDSLFHLQSDEQRGNLQVMAWMSNITRQKFKDLTDIQKNPNILAEYEQVLTRYAGEPAVFREKIHDYWWYGINYMPQLITHDPSSLLYKRYGNPIGDKLTAKIIKSLLYERIEDTCDHHA